MKYLSIINISAMVAGIIFFCLYIWYGKFRSLLFDRLPSFLRKFKERARLRRMESQLVGTIDMLLNCVKAGLSLQGSFEMIACDGPADMRAPFSRMMNQIKMGVGLDAALKGLARENPLQDLEMAVEAMLVLRKTGGNLAETLAAISRTIQERQKVSGKIRVMVSQGLFQAVTITAMPFFLILALRIVSPWFVEPLYTTGLGVFLMACMVALQTIGIAWMKRIIHIKV